MAASNSESGHAKNAANFEQLTIDVAALGTTYNPSNVALKSPALSALLATIKTSISTASTANATHTAAISVRNQTFAPLGKESTRIFNAVKASGASSQVIDSVQTLERKLQGRRATPKLTAAAIQAATAAGQTVTENSSSQMSFDNRIDNFDKLIKLLGTITAYNPNEADLKITALTAQLADFRTKNLAVVNANTAHTNARIARNAVMYTTNTGSVDVAMSVKNYIKSVFGVGSPQFNQVSSLKFVNYGL